METRVIPFLPARPFPAAEDLGRLLREGRLVAFPTETVYGVAAAARVPGAVRALRALKGRDAERPLTVHLADAAGIPVPLSPAARRLARRLWPGPLTLVLPSPGGSTGFRVPDHPAARAILAAAAIEVVATSVNRSGDPPAVDEAEALALCDGRVDAVVAAGRCRLAAASTVVRVDPAGLVFLRDGALPREEVLRASCFHVLFVCTGNLCRSPLAEGIVRRVLADRLGVHPGDLPGRGILLSSAGTGALAGEPATPEAVEAARRYGADLSGHRARPLTPTLLAGADLIYVAEPRHARVVEEYDPAAAVRTRTLLAGGAGLADPFGGTEEDYRRAARSIRKAAERMAGEVESAREEG